MEKNKEKVSPKNGMAGLKGFDRELTERLRIELWTVGVVQKPRDFREYLREVVR